MLRPLGQALRQRRVTEAACWAHARRPWWDLHLSLGRSPARLPNSALAHCRALRRRSRHTRPAARATDDNARHAPGRCWRTACMAGSMVERVSAKSEIAGASATRSRGAALALPATTVASRSTTMPPRRVAWRQPGSQELRLHGVGRGRRTRGGDLQPRGDAKLNGLDPEGTCAKC